MIKFIKAASREQSKFGMVGDAQFFVNDCGHLCQKQDHFSYSVIADKNGDPYCVYITDYSPDVIIQEILPTVTKIEF